MCAGDQPIRRKGPVPLPSAGTSVGGRAQNRKDESLVGISETPHPDVWKNNKINSVLIVRMVLNIYNTPLLGFG